MPKARRRRCRYRRRKSIPIQVTGPPAQRLNLIVLGDGYQWDQQSIFLADVDRNLSVMWATEPFRSYRNYINVYAVEIASIDYGTRCDPDGRVRSADGTIRDTGVREGPIETKNTALRMEFQGGCTDPLARGTVYRNSGPVGCNAAEAREVLPARGHVCVRKRQRGAQPDPRQLRRAGPGDPAHVAEPPDTGDLQHLHLWRHRRRPGDHVRRLPRRAR